MTCSTCKQSFLPWHVIPAVFNYHDAMLKAMILTTLVDEQPTNREDLRAIGELFNHFCRRCVTREEIEAVARAMHVGEVDGDLSSFSDLLTSDNKDMVLEAASLIADFHTRKRPEHGAVCMEILEDIEHDLGVSGSTEGTTTIKENEQKDKANWDSTEKSHDDDLVERTK